MHAMKFHKHHGQNICISDDGQTATRTCSFAHAICFGDRPLCQGEIFMVEITRNERGWSGHLRIGLTQHDPNTGFTLPQYALPDLVSMLGKSWIMAVTKARNRLYIDDDMQDILDGEEVTPKLPVLGTGDWVKTSRGTIKRSALLPQILKYSTDSEDDQPDDKEQSLLPTDVASKLGVIFVKRNNRCDLYLIVNGDEYGPFAKDIPISEGPLWPVVDVYGTTKQVKIVQLQPSESLMSCCRDKVLQMVTEKDIDELPLPGRLKEFLRFES